MDRYHKVERPKPDIPISENEIRITSQGAIRNYITYASTLLQEKRLKEIVLKAMGQAINKTVAITEIIKKRIPHLHQDTAISSVSITDVWEPIEEGLVPVEMTRQVSMISITLSARELNTNSPGYQAPQHVEQPKPQYRHQQYQHQHQHQYQHQHQHQYQHQHQNQSQHQHQPPRQGRISYDAVNEDSYGRGWGQGRGRGRGRNYGRGGYGNYGNYQENDGYSNWGRGGGRGRGWGYRGPGYERGRGGGDRGYYGRGRGRMGGRSRGGASCEREREIMEATKETAAAAAGSSITRKDDLFHVIHKVPAGDGPYVLAKHAQLVQKDPEAAIVLFRKAINAGDRVDSALKDMAVVMKQLHRPEQAIQAIKSFRLLCSKQAQDPLDNILIDLYKKCSRVEEQIELLKRKLRKIYRGEAFNGKPTKTARSHGKKFRVSVKQETSRLLGNLGWAYMQKSNFMAAEVVYKKAQMVDPDANKACNLGICLMKQGRYGEAHSVLEAVTALQGTLQPGSEDFKPRKRAEELLLELESRRRRRQQQPPEPSDLLGLNLDTDFVNGLEQQLMMMNRRGPSRSKRLPIFEQISSLRDQLVC